MADHSRDLRLVVKALPAGNARPNEFAHSLVPHPLIYQELAFDPEYIVYAGRISSVAMNNATPDELYWMVRRQVVLRHTAELPLEIKGPDAEQLLDLVLTRSIAAVKVGRCSYQIACYHDGGMITDGVLLRLAKDRFWYVQADGDLFSWFRAHAAGLDAEVFDPGVFVSQVQGPDSLRVLELVIDGEYPDPFRYFDLAHVRIAGQPVTISRTGFSNELGWEFYLGPDADPEAVGDRILEVGEPLGMQPCSAEVFRSRRIEAGILNAGSDFDETTTPYAAGLGGMVDLAKEDFIGKAALQAADQRSRTWGMRVDGGVAHLGASVYRDGEPAGVVCSSGWSPFQRCGVAIVRLDDPALGPGTTLQAECTDGEIRNAETCATPMYDEKREIPRGILVDIP